LELLAQRNAAAKQAIAPLREFGLAVMEAQFAFLNEGADIAMSLQEVADGNMYAAIGILPGIPSSVSKVIIGSAAGGAVAKLILQGERLERFKTFVGRLRVPLKQAKKGDALLIDTIDGARARCIYLKDEGQLLTRAQLEHIYDIRKTLSVEKKISRKLLAENLITSGKLDPSTPSRMFQAHHDLPLEFERQFVIAGIDPNDADYGRWVPQNIHAAWSNGSPGRGGPFNLEWRKFFFTEQGAPITRNRSEILVQLTVMRSGIYQYP
jgi:hypothetical protein